MSEAINLPPGRELDALVAEKVMGLEPWPEQDSRWECKAFRAPIIPQGVEPKPCAPPNYSTGIAAAWEVVEKLVALDYRVRVTAYRDNSYGVTLSFPLSAGKRDGLFEAETAPHAICLAALKAIAPNGAEGGK